MTTFIEAMREFVPDYARILMCQFRGDPGDDIKGKWRAYVLNNTSQIDEKANVYFCVSAMKQNARREYRRRKENFAGGLLLMIDDLGTGPGAKFPMSTIDALPPTALIETSPDNFQAIYMFSELLRDEMTFQKLITAFIDKEFLGNDTGMAGVNRVFRPPFGVNGKPKYGGWEVRLAEADYSRRYSVDEIVEAFELVLEPPGRWVRRDACVDRPEAIRAFIRTRQQLRAAGLLKTEATDLAGWADIRCPWTEAHTGAVDNGAAIREPHHDNQWSGAFKCHHASCAGKGWRELTDWLNEEAAEILAMVNDSAYDFTDYEVRDEQGKEKERESSAG